MIHSSTSNRERQGICYVNADINIIYYPNAVITLI